MSNDNKDYHNCNSWVFTWSIFNVVSKGVYGMKDFLVVNGVSW